MYKIFRLKLEEKSLKDQGKDEQGGVFVRFRR
jgi:hypothetical protein